MTTSKASVLLDEAEYTLAIVPTLPGLQRHGKGGMDRILEAYASSSDEDEVPAQRPRRSTPANLPRPDIEGMFADSGESGFASQKSSSSKL